MADKKKIKEEKVSKLEDSEKFKGRFISAIGRRKTSVAQVRLYKNGKGNILVNNLKLNKYFDTTSVSIINQPLKLTSHQRNLDFSILVKGGGKYGQTDAVRHGIVRALILFDKELRDSLKVKGWLTRDPRKVERKKPGLKKARRAPQWSKR